MDSWSAATAIMVWLNTFFFLPEFTSFCGLAGAYGDGKENKCGAESLAGWLVGHPGG